MSPSPSQRRHWNAQIPFLFFSRPHQSSRKQRFFQVNKRKQQQQKKKQLHFPWADASQKITTEKNNTAGTQARSEENTN